MAFDSSRLSHKRRPAKLKKKAAAASYLWTPHILLLRALFAGGKKRLDKETGEKTPEVSGTFDREENSI